MKRKKIVLFAALLAAAGMASLAALQLQQQALSDKLVRLHVVANSDEKADQALKLKVRDAVLAVTEPLMEESEDPRGALAASLSELQAAAEACLAANGCEDRVQVSLGSEVFPTRVYETFALPAGTYASLRVTIGEGAGHNWWCVVFPSICFRATAADLEEAAEAAGFTEDEVRLITEDGGGYTLKFKALELLQELKSLLFPVR